MSFRASTLLNDLLRRVHVVMLHHRVALFRRLLGYEQVCLWLGEAGREADSLQKLAHCNALARLIDLLNELVQLGNLVLVMLAL